mgnify:CR=1 FL=1
MITHWEEQAPEAPFYAVIFISKKSRELEGYQEADESLMAEARQQAGYLGYSSLGREDEGIFISYWRDKSSIEQWRAHGDHLVAKANGRKKWYDYYHSMICRVESSRVFQKEISRLL